jgi:hypothetical protein
VKKLLMPFVVGLAIGLAGTTAAIVFIGGGPKSLTESLAETTGEAGEQSDSVEVGGAEHEQEGGDSVTVASAAEHVEETVADSSVVLPAGEAVDLSEDLPVSSDIGAPPAAGSTAADEPKMEPARLAKVFASMQAREAARVLEHLNDSEIQVILAGVGNREAAAILSNLTPERAAVISRAVISGERSSQ